MFEYARPGDSALLGNVADKEQRGGVVFSETEEERGAFADLGDAARRESMTTMSGRCCARTASTASTDVSVTRFTGADSTPRRRARSATCSVDSSPET
jgi:hypothetical protein